MTSTDALPLTATLTPASQAEVAEAVRDAGGKGAAVYPIGGGTRLDYGGRPKRQGIGLSLSRLNRVVDYPAGDLTITVEAGITINELSKCLAAQRQRLPVDCPMPDRATVGGAVAVNAAGPRRYGCGTIRDYLLGFTAVDGTGTAFSGGGRVVKNAAGYNMCRLMVGSLGTLGVITQVTLMVRPMPEASALLTCPIASLDLAETLLAGLVHSATRPVAIELVSGAGCQPAVFRADCQSAPRLDAACLYVGFEGSTLEVDWMADQLRREWAETGIAEPTLISGDLAQATWRRLADGDAHAEIRVLPSAVAGVIGNLLEAAPSATIHAHAGNGVVRLTTGNGWSTDAISQFRSVAAAHGGHMTVLKHPENADLAAAEIWGPAGPEIRTMQAIKERFDPQNILNPGRFVY
jgi:glycolate oxidase FAD binding subunit